MRQCRFAHAQLIEVNAHSLFSKWFSESGKLVTALFSVIKEAVEEEDTLVFVLVDEVTPSSRSQPNCPTRLLIIEAHQTTCLRVAAAQGKPCCTWNECSQILCASPRGCGRPLGSQPVAFCQVESLTAARSAAVSGSEPADSVRAVNALLTALDSLKAHSNVMMLTTSNITEAIDVAFLDRADIKAYLGPPELQACASLAVAVDIVIHSRHSFAGHTSESALFADS